MNLRAGPLALIVLGLGCLTTAPAFAQSVTLAWDASPESGVAGYVVYVGSASGSYQERYDVGNQTSFMYTRAETGRPYYFAVSAYARGPNIGAPSEEVFFLAGDPPAWHDGTSIPAATAAATTGTRQILCAGARDGDCYVADRLASLAANTSSLTPSGDGRLFLIEDGRRIRIIEGDALVPEPALSIDSVSTQLAGLVVDPAFTRNRFVWVGEITTRPDGTRELSIMRYREVANVLAEGAVIVAGLPLPPLGDAPFTMDVARRLYVAIPADRNSYARSSPYSGMVLRFESDGTVSRNSPAGSPVFARGYAQPTSLVWSGTANELWLTGSDTEWAGPLARLPLNRESVEWPAIPQRTGLATSAAIVSLAASELDPAESRTKRDRADFVLVDETGGVVRIDLATAGMIAAAPIPTNDLGGRATSAVIGPDTMNGDIYLSLTNANGDSSPSSHIIRLRHR